ncbi:NACHT domain-containing protein [Micromonospora sp. NPDC049460]|uniref:NACHT domain-containing protein n=1 Tax=Micromonospora sp. NPDC049460 TaxID=3364272 RepID=UPI0037A93ADE
MRLEFETGAETDDLACIFSDGSRMDISAKRRCGDDRHLRKTIEQWVSQAEKLTRPLLLGLAVAEPVGIVRDLGKALKRRRDGVPVFPASEKAALEALTSRLSGVDEQMRAKILDAAHVLKIEAVEPGDPEYELAVASMEGSLVRHGDGAKAFRALSSLMHIDAGKAYVCGAEDWLNAIDDAGVPIFADLRGPLGAALHAQRIALAEYRARLCASAGLIDLTLLADDLPPFVVEGLADGLRVTVPARSDRPVTEKLLHVARRWTRMSLIGLPGMGKTTAVNQIAACWAADEDAPTPVVVPLLSVAERCRRPSDVTLSVFCEIASASAEGAQRDALCRALERECSEGRAALILDGLDECGSRTGTVAQGLRAVIDALPTHTGVLLTTRFCAQKQARLVNLPAATLITPADLNDVLDRLLCHVADVRIDEAARENWTELRRTWLEQTRHRHRDLGDVPLLATLLALVVAETGDAKLPASRALLLKQAVELSVSRWERRRDHAHDLVEVQPTSDQLLAAYAAIAHLLAISNGTVSDAERNAAVIEVLRERWELSLGAATETAREIARFWDDRIGVFVATDRGVASRSRVFTEIGMAMRARQLDDSQIASWVRMAVPADDQREALMLAADLEPRVMFTLVRDLTDEGSALIAAAASRAGAAIQDDQTILLMERLARAAQEAMTVDAQEKDHGSNPSQRREQADRDGRYWKFVLALAWLRVPGRLRPRRAELIGGLALEEERRTVAAGVVALADADNDGRALTVAEADQVRAMLRLPRPERPPLLKNAHGAFEFQDHPLLLTGYVDAALAAAPHLDLLGNDLRNEIREISGWVDIREYEEAAGTLKRHGVSLGLERTMASFATLFEPIERAGWERPLLEAVAALSTKPVKPTMATWRYSSLGILIAALGADHVTIGGYTDAITVDSADRLQGWVGAVAAAAGLDAAEIAGQARRAIAERERDLNQKDLWVLLTVPLPAELTPLDANRLGAKELEALIDALQASSGWIANLARKLLSDITDEALRSRIATSVRSRGVDQPR